MVVTLHLSPGSLMRHGPEKARKASVQQSGNLSQKVTLASSRTLKRASWVSALLEFLELSKFCS
jgi:hypothetical protein